jgi:amino acid transporter
MENNVNLQSFGYEQELKKALSSRDIVFYGISFMGPVSVCTLFGIMHVTSQGHAPLAYFLAFVAALFTALSYGKMVEAFPVAGSTYSYTQRGIHPALGFMSGWVILLDYVFVPIMLYLVCSIGSNAIFPQIPISVWIPIWAVPAIIVNILGVDIMAKINNVFIVLMYATLVGFVILAIVAFAGGNTPEPLSITAIYNPSTFSMSALVRGVGVAVVSFIGFDAMTTLVEETPAASSKIKRGVVIVCVIAVITYVVVSFFEANLAPAYTLVTNPDDVYYEFIVLIPGGVTFGVLSSIVFVVTGWAVILASLAAASRILYGMGRDRLVPAFFARVHPRFKTPFIGVLILGVITLILSEFISLTLVSELVSFGGLFGFSCVNLAVIVHFYFRQKSRKLVSHLIIPAIGTVVCVYVMVGLSPLAKTVGLVWIGIGVAYLAVRCGTSTDFRRKLAEITFKETM